MPQKSSEPDQMFAVDVIYFYLDQNIESDMMFFPKNVCFIVSPDLS